jgi:putative ABC transport system permease protein
VGDTLTLKYGGDTQNWRIVGIVDTQDMQNGNPIFAHYDTVTRFIGAPNQANLLLVRTSARVLDVQSRVERMLADDFDRRNIEVASTDNNGSLLANALQGFDIVIGLLLMTAVLIAVVGGLGLAGTMSLSVMERTREIGVMRSVGAGTGTLRYMFILEGLIIGMISYIIALAISIPTTIGFAAVLGGAMFGKPFSTAFTPMGAVIWLVLVVLVSVLASVAPAQRASQISIREALTYE